jgi:hypothetical protein
MKSCPHSGDSVGDRATSSFFFYDATFGSGVRRLINGTDVSACGFDDTRVPIWFCGISGCSTVFTQAEIVGAASAGGIRRFSGEFLGLTCCSESVGGRTIDIPWFFGLSVGAAGFSIRWKKFILVCWSIHLPLAKALRRAIG